MGGGLKTLLKVLVSIPHFYFSFFTILLTYLWHTMQDTYLMTQLINEGMLNTHNFVLDMCSSTGMSLSKPHAH